MKYILLNWMSPSLIEMPSPAMSVLKKYLSFYNYEVKIEYWNMKLNKLENEFLWNLTDDKKRDENNALLLYDNYLAIKYNDIEAISNIKGFLIGLRPSLLSADPYYIDRHMNSFYHKLDEFLNDEIAKIKWDDVLYVGFSAKLYQWIPSSIICKKIKHISPQTIVVLGGMESQYAAIDFLENFHQFDFATWGEGEYAIKLFSDVVSNKNDASELYSIPHLAFRAKDGIYTSKQKLSNFVDLNKTEYYPDFFDYISKKNEYRIQQAPFLFIESSRGCHWGKCHFCYLNKGYRHRVKDIVNVRKYVEEAIKKYNIYNFAFLDNDLVANDFSRFNSLLDSLIEIKYKYPDFSIILAEIITKDFTETFIRKMSLAGFNSVQIGYESPSDKLLTKIDKKNSYASNLLFIKFAYKYGININGMNVICGLLEETNEDVSEAIENLRYQRFFLNTFSHNMSKLAIMHTSRYFEKLKNDNSFRLNKVYNFLPKNLLSNEIINNCNIIEKVKMAERNIWHEFIKIEKYYKENSFSYKIFNNDSYILYQEFLNKGKINEIEINKDSLEYFILEKANSKVVSFTNILYEIHSNEKFSYFLECEIINVIEEIKKEGLLYVSFDYSELLTVIDIREVI